jgi:hypothetical protein
MSKRKFAWVAALMFTPLAANAASLLGNWNLSVSDSVPTLGGFTGVMDFQSQSPAGDISGTFTALTQTSDWTGCSALPCSWDWSGTVTGGGSGIDIYGVGSYEYLGNLSSNGEMLTGTYQGPTGPGVTPTDFGTWTASRVPEPATLWLFGIGLAALRLLGRRRRA